MSGPRRGRRPKRRANGQSRPYPDGNVFRGKVRDENGVVVRRVSDPDYDECVKKLKAAREEWATGRVDRDHPTVAQLAAQWCEQAESLERTQESTRSVQLPRIRVHIIEDRVLGAMRADTVRVDDVEAWLQQKQKDGYHRGDRRYDYSPAYLRDMRADLRAIFTWAVRRERMKYNPASDAQIIGIKHNHKRTLTKDQLDKLINECITTDRRYGTYVLCGLLLGARPGEIAGLSWDAIDWDAGVIHIYQALKRRSGGAPLAIGPTKTSETRQLEASPLLLTMLRRERAEQARLRLLAGADWSTDWDGLVFLGADGVPPYAGNLRRSLRELCALADIEVDDLDMYELRHTFASQLTEAGVPVERIIDQLGHADSRMYYRHYRHKVNPVVTGVAGVLEEYLGLNADGSRDTPR